MAHSLPEKLTVAQLLNNTPSFTELEMYCSGKIPPVEPIPNINGAISAAEAKDNFCLKSRYWTKKSL
jgi:hypothetical protein